MVRTHRRRLGLTQEELAGTTGLSARNIRNLEAGRIGSPRPTTVRLLADAFGLTGTERDRFCQVAAGPPDLPLPATPHIPSQLPPDVAAFTGREEELARLDDLLAGAADQPTAVVISAIAGTAGIGKTALAVHWAHRVRDRFPDGQLFLNLRGFDPAGLPLTPSEGTRILLDALQVPPARIPVTLDAQVGLYRSQLTGRRVLVVLDNVYDAEQVRPLLPAAGGCMAVVTSRNPLLSLVASEGAQPFALDLLPRQEARELLARRLGTGRVAGEPDAADELIVRCAGLPLALAIVAARAVAHPTFQLRELALELAVADNVLDTIGEPGTTTDLRTVFSWSYRSLSADAARGFRLLSLHPGPDLATATAASLLGTPAVRASRLLAELQSASLITERAPGRYSLHDLLRAYAHQLAHAIDSDPDRREAWHRMLDHYLYTAGTASRLLHPARNRPAPTLRAGVAPVPLASAGDAQEWFDTERAALLGATSQALDTGLDLHATQLANELVWFLDQAGHWADQLRVQQVALVAAKRLADPTTLAHARRRLGIAYARLGDWPAAERQLRQALDMFVELGEPIQLAGAYSSLGAVSEQQGDYDEALRHNRQALELAYAAGHEPAQARILNAIGWCHTLRGEHEQAIIHCEQALARYQRIDDPSGSAKAWDTLGFARDQLGGHREAIGCYRRALELLDRTDNRDDRAIALTHLGDSHHAIGERDAARRAWQAALEVVTQLGMDPAAAGLRAKLQHLADR
jgi:tetratricopeptide (TPR) repeat protein/transcriptional regulator with XRE-family HTH domain